MSGALPGAEAGRITVAGPTITGPKVAVLQATAKTWTAKPLSAGAAWERVMMRTARALASPQAAVGALKHGVGVGVAVRASAKAVLKSAVVTRAAVAAARLAVSFAETALKFNDIPEIARLNSSLSRLTVAVADIVDTDVVPAIDAIGLAVRSIDAHVALVVAVGRYQIAAMRVAWTTTVRAAAARIDRAIGARGLTATAGIERRGTTMPALARTATSGGALARFPAITFPGSSTFTEPRAVIADDRVSRKTIVAMARAAATAAVMLAAPAAAGAAQGVIASAAADLAASKAELRARAIGDASAMATAATGVRKALERLDGAPSMPAEVEVKYSAMLEAFSQARVWDEIRRGARAAVHSLEAGMRSVVKIAMARITSYGALLTDKLPAQLAAAQKATDALNDALALDLSLLQKVTSSSAAAVHAFGVAQLAIVGGLAIAKAIESSIKAAAAFVRGVLSGDYWEFIQYSAALVAYTAAAAFAGVAVSGLEGAPSESGGEDGSGAGMVGRREATLTVYAPGYLRPKEIADLIVASQRSGAGTYAPGARLTIKPRESLTEGEILGIIGGTIEEILREPWWSAFGVAERAIQDTAREVERTAERVAHEVDRGLERLGVRI